MQDSSLYLKATFDHFSAIYTKKKFGNISAAIGDTTDYQLNREKLLELAPNRRQSIQVKCPHTLLIKDATTEKPDNREASGNQFYICDGLIADSSTTNVWFSPADCAILVLYYPDQKITCLIHASRKTLPLGIIGKALKQYLLKLSSLPSDLHAYISPAIRAKSYVFPADIADALFDESWQPFLTDNSKGGVEVDIVKRCLAELEDGGIRPESIIVSPEDTGNGTYFTQSGSRLDQSLDGRNGFLVFYS